jgi:GalNAc-alpha-(1->4)-GalNAc-alpha-(1->3)-diNAcBac-PP-undecaprenol alpha-1,4-N-acetyl-D-galactosaminyltransferase
VLRMTLVVASLRGGGAERVLSRMANYWAGKGWPITVLTLYHGPASPSYALDPRVRHHDMRFSKQARHPLPDAGALRALKATFDCCSVPERRTLLFDLHLIVALRHAIQRARPDVVISFIDSTNVRVLLAVEALGVPVVVSERSDPHSNVLGEGMRRLRKRLYPRAAYLVTQTDEMAAFFAREMGARGRVIHNPVVRPSMVPARIGDATSPDAAHLLLAMGRLVDEKGFPLLIRAFAQLAAKHPSWSLEIWGIGPLRPALERLARNLGLNGRVRLPGFTLHPADVLARGDLFALSSISEGFPNALCEAMAAGLPVVSFNCSSGIRQIIRDGIDGVIVETANVASLAASLDRLMSSEDERARLGARAVEVADRFAIDKAMAQWEALAYACARRPLPRAGGGPDCVGTPPAVMVRAVTDWGTDRGASRVVE